jgi:hypothetical protein
MNWDSRNFLGFDLNAQTNGRTVHWQASGFGGPIAGSVQVDAAVTVDLEVWFGGDAPGSQVYQLTSRFDLTSSVLASSASRQTVR